MLTFYRLVQLFADGTAFGEAQLRTEDDWKNAAEFFGLTLDDLKSTTSGYVALPANHGMNPKFKPTVLQVVGAFALFQRMYGDSCGAILADEMGLGKTVESLMVIAAKYSYAVQTYDEHPCENPLPAIKDGLMGSRKPRIGVTWVQASAPGLAAWPKAFKMMLEGSKLIEDRKIRDDPESDLESREDREGSEDREASDWSIRMVILHERGKEFAEAFGGEKCGIYYNLTPKEQMLIRGKPDWSKAHAIYDPYVTHKSVPWNASPSDVTEWGPEPVHLYNGDYDPLATCYIIVTTRQSIPTRWFDTRTEHKDFRKELKVLKPKPGHKPLVKAQKEEGYDSIRLFLKGKTSNPDGKHLTQVTRRGRYKNEKWVTWVADCYRGAELLIDELHDTKDESTITYRSFVAPFKALRPELQPAVVGITGSPYEDGVKTICTFAIKALKRDDWRDSGNETLQAIYSLDSNFASIWNRLLNKLSKDKVNAGQVAAALNGDADIQKMIKALAKIMSDIFVWRNMESVDPWGRPLVKNVPELITEWVPIKYDENIVAEMGRKEKELRKQAAAELAARKVEAGGKVVSGGMSRELQNEYHLSLVEATLPNLIQTLREWDDMNPDKPPFLPSGEAVSLGQKNAVLQEELKTANLCPGGVLWDLTPKIIKGSKKMDYIFKLAEEIHGMREKIPDPLHPSKTVEVRKKWIHGSSIRIVAAVQYCVSGQVCSVILHVKVLT
jgi:hypothetical protein